MDYFFEGVGNEILSIVVIYFMIIFMLLIKCLKYEGGGNIMRLRRYLRNIFHNDSIVVSNFNEECESEANLDPSLEVRIFNTDCCVCLSENCSYPVTSGCGHCFCGMCVMNLIKHNSVLMKCPLCRQECHVLILPFCDIQNNNDELQDLIVNSVLSYNTRIENRFPFVNHVRNVPVMLRHLVRSFISFRGHLIFRLKCHVILAAFLAAGYLTLSTDLIPEHVFGLPGLIDDVVVIVTLGILVSHTYTSIDSSVTFEDIRAALE